MPNAELERLAQVSDEAAGWRRWGPYVADRSWATVREDYSPDGDAWNYLPHELARSQAYRWGEDGIAGVCDRYQVIALSWAFWNERDRMLKERLFGVTPQQGNHGEDVKEYYFYLDATPTHSYMKFLYKYAQSAYPYDLLVAENRRRGSWDFEYELIDTGAFVENRYFDIVIEYAKADEEDLCIRVTASNRGPAPASLHILPQLVFRNTWSWGPRPCKAPRIEIGSSETNPDQPALLVDDAELPPMKELVVPYHIGKRWLYYRRSGSPIFTENETNHEVVGPRGGWSNSPHVKDAFHRHIVGGQPCVNPAQRGSKAAVHHRLESIEPGESKTLEFRFTPRGDLLDPLEDVASIIEQRRAEADEFHASIQPPGASAEERAIQRQAFAGLLWTKQIYLMDVNRWLIGSQSEPAPHPHRSRVRNQHWRHLNSMRVLSMPDKWEYPWFAAWDLAFHCVTLALVDAKFAKDQLGFLLFEQFIHPNGQIPAYEWEFSDLNPPVHAWAVWRVYNMDRIASGRADREFLERCFHKLLINFTWWINRVDRHDNNIFEGGFLGLDNITVVDRSLKCSDGANLEQSDATGWMGMFCLNMMRMALELAKQNRVYESLAIKFFQHYVYVAAAMKRMGGRQYQLWDEDDGFFYDVLSYPDGNFAKFRVRSLVGLIPLFAVERLEADWIKPFTNFSSAFQWFMSNRRELVKDVVHPIEQNGQINHALTIVDRHQLHRILARVWDSSEFLSPYGIRSLSKEHLHHPFTFDGRVVGYEPAEAITKFKGGNSNWRGPIWFPTCFLLVESLRKLAKAFGPEFAIQPNDQPGVSLTFLEMAEQLANRMISIFARDPETGMRPVHGGHPYFQRDDHWRELILFYEYFHGDNGAGLGASHQTGWTALVASLIDEWRR